MYSCIVNSEDKDIGEESTERRKEGKKGGKEGVKERTKEGGGEGRREGGRKVKKRRDWMTQLDSIKN